MRRSIALLLVLLLTLGIVAYAEDMSEVKTPEVLKMDVRGEEVQSLQSKLNELGFYCGKADGIFGPRTEAALKELQGAIGWDVTGEVRVADLQTLLSLTDKDVLSGSVEKTAEAPESEEAEISADDQPEVEVEAGEATETEASVEAENVETTETEVPSEETEAAMVEATSEEAEPAEVLAADEQPVDGDNLIWDGDFQNPEKYWSNWGHPTVCEIVEIDGKNWLHVVSSGEKYEGMNQSVNCRSGDSATPEILAGSTYTLSFKAFAADSSVDKLFKCGVHNRSMDGQGINQEQYWTPGLSLTKDVQTYTLMFTPDVDGTFNVMIGTGYVDQIDAYFTDISIIPTPESDNP